MDHVTSSTFWSSLTIIASCIGATFFISIAHSNEPKHGEAAFEKDVTAIQVRLERVQTNVEHNSALLGDLKGELKELRIEQSEQSREILEAIRSAPQN
jgi:hypothetical protein